ncbi:hypothetical protein [Actinacidiphila glaucinigra]|uniref:Uncharacterized protein n=1 Tax=Actinacidiphila glaucinigra TaxID=235986 RepID=A0A239LVX1_9ACTN|nr:hypothetical protein [Actinacidiphila glaucinigra]SNT33859.1 hypothetical protein SAMN05216252_12177 [Actinacidiphila glaucinigra]
MLAVRMAATVLATWLCLIVALIAPSLLPQRWQWYIYSPASVGLWMLTMVVAPFVVCIFVWRWIKAGGK